MSRLGVRKLQVIKSSKTFDEVFREGRKSHSEHFVVVVKPSPAGRVGFAVSKKVRGAVHRNRAKRRLREIVRTNKQILPTTLDMVCVAKPGLESTRFETLNEEYLHLISRLLDGCNRRQ